ncbi:hypothetical protein MPSI1_000600 [Malassezia psittaci]|uniref:C2H2-type domain-containing protein n=1 Tax=Malassezia psittaci TaxID=1821823 RepID=A0AAF0FBY1_9BASI|nr:hypothetical protein MPSI1_000600 [Malassezia psittaci]
MPSEHTPPLHDSVSGEHATVDSNSLDSRASSHDSNDTPFGILSSSPTDLGDPFNSVPMFLGLDSYPNEPSNPSAYSLSSSSILWQSLKQPSYDPAWSSHSYSRHSSDSRTVQGSCAEASPSHPDPFLHSEEPQRRASEMLPNSVADLRLDTPSSNQTRLSGSPFSSQTTLGEANCMQMAYASNSQAPQTPRRPTTLHRSPVYHSAPQTRESLVPSSLDDETPIKHTSSAEVPSENPLPGSFLYDLNATTPAMLANTLPPMTPMAAARHDSMDGSRTAPVRTHRSGPSIGSSSAISASTPEYGSAQSIASSVDLRSPGYPFETNQLDMSPHKSTQFSYSGNEAYGPMYAHLSRFPHIPMTPQGNPAVQHRMSGQAHYSLDEPFTGSEHLMSPHSYAPPTAIPSSLLFCDQSPHDPKVIARTSSAPSLQPAGMPSWPSDHELGMYTPGPETTSFPASPTAYGPNLPVSSTAMARKCYTPYAKTAPSPLFYGSPLEIDPFFSHNGMPTSKSMNAIASPSSGPMSPMTPSGIGRRRPQLPESISMPGDQMASMLNFESSQPAVRVRGRNSGPPPLVVSSADKLHVCHCGRRFKRMEHLKRHNRTHTQERPHKCPVESCGKSFGRSDNLAQHLKTHYRPSGLVGRSIDALQSEPNDPVRARDRRHDPHAAAAAAAAAAASAAINNYPESTQESMQEAQVADAS